MKGFCIVCGNPVIKKKAEETSLPNGIIVKALTQGYFCSRCGIKYEFPSEIRLGAINEIRRGKED